MKTIVTFVVVGWLLIVAGIKIEEQGKNLKFVLGLVMQLTGWLLWIILAFVTLKNLPL